MPIIIDASGKYFFTLFSNIDEDSFAEVSWDEAAVGWAITLLSTILETQEDNRTKVINNIVRYLFKGSF